MANACGLFGDLIPNVYIDRVFLEESLQKTENGARGGSTTVETPTISIGLKVIDTPSANGTLSILGEALQIESANSTLDFKDFMKVHCVVFPTPEIANDFITKLEDGNYTETNTYFSLPQPESQDPYYLKTKTLKDFNTTFVNAEDQIEIGCNYVFDKNDFGNNDVFDYLRVLTFIELDTHFLESELNLDLPSSFKCIVSKYCDQVIIRNSVVASEMTIFLTDDGDLWDDSFHVHNDSQGRIYMEGRVHTPDTPHGILTKATTVVNNVQDFRIRDEINVFLANLDTTTSAQLLFPEQKDLLNQSQSKNSYFSEILITKDDKRNARFYFAFDYGKFVLQEDKFSGLISKMTTTAKSELIKNAQMVKFILRRRQVREKAALNHLGSPVLNKTMSDGALDIPVVTSLDDSNINEINVILLEQEPSKDSYVRHFTGFDTGMIQNTDGMFQYSIEVEIVSAFSSIMNQLMKNLDLALSSFNEYANLTQIPGVYDKTSRKFTTAGQTIMSSFGSSRLSTIINVYLDSLDYFVELDDVQASRLNLTLRQSLTANIIRNINYTDGSVDGIILFQKLLQDLMAQISNVLSTGSNSVGVEATKNLPPSDRIGLLKNTTIGAIEFFDNTIGARFINDIYVDNISAARVNTRRHPGLRVYEGTDLSKASVTEVTPFSSITIGTSKAAEAQGVIVNIMPNLELGNLLPNPLQQISAYGGSGGPKSDLPAFKFLGKNSPGADKNLNSETLSAKDLKTDATLDTNMASLSLFQGLKVDKNLRTQGIVSDGISSFTSEELKGEVEVLTSYSVDTTTTHKGVSVTGKAYMIRNPVFELKRIGDLKSSVSNRYYLCRQRAQGLKEVVDTYFLLNPVSVTFDTTRPIEFQAGQFMQQAPALADTVVEQIAEVSNPANITMEGVQSSFMTPVESYTQTSGPIITRNIAQTVTQQIADVSNPANMTMQGVQSSFTAPAISQQQIAEVSNPTNMTMQGVQSSFSVADTSQKEPTEDLTAAVEAPAKVSTVAQQLEDVVQGMTPAGISKSSMFSSTSKKGVL